MVVGSDEEEKMTGLADSLIMYVTVLSLILHILKVLPQTICFTKSMIIQIADLCRKI